MRLRPVLANVFAVALLVLTGCAGVPGTSRAPGPSGASDGRGAVRQPAGSAGPAAPSSGQGAGRAREPAAGRAPRPAPASLSFTAETLDGRRYEAAALVGRPAVLWFWAPWCATCAGQAPSVAEAAKRYGDRLSVLGVAGFGDVAAMRQFVSDTDVGAVPHLNDRTGAVWRRFEVAEQSIFVFLDRDGRVVHKGWLDSVEFAERVAAIVAG